MAQGSKQPVLEIFPIRRHLEEFIDKYMIPAQCFFIAPSIHIDTERYCDIIQKADKLFIAPYSIDDFVDYLETSKTLYKSLN